MKWIICDKNKVVQDISTVEKNLSRGYSFLSYKKHQVDRTLDVRIGDSYNGKKVKPNIKLRNAQIIKTLKVQIIELSLRKREANFLGFNDIELEITEKSTQLEQQLAQLEVK